MKNNRLRTIKRIVGLSMAIVALGIATISSVAYAANEDTNTEEKEQQSDTRMYLGEAVYSGDSDGYAKHEPIERDNPHFGWKLGDFYVSGFIRAIDENVDVPVFLKNVGDTVKLSFVLNQDIEKLDGKEELSIGSDEYGYDEQLGIVESDFGKGMLAIRYTDYQGKTKEPTLHKDYLKAVKLGADTEVELCEEGDYEIVLDYQIEVDNAWYEFYKQSSFDYRIHFQFSVRNGDCMIFPFDVKTHSELTNSAVTPNGFYLDFAKTRYLDIDIKKEVLNETENGLVEDTRFNKPAADGEEFVEEGIYTITATNRYTNQSSTVKKIYVGTNNVLMAHAKTNLSIDEINKQLANGTTVNEDGSLEYASIKVEESDDKPVVTDKSDIDEKKEVSVNSVIDYVEKKPIMVAVIVGVAFVVMILLFLIVKKKSRKSKRENEIDREENK